MERFSYEELSDSWLNFMKKNEVYLFFRLIMEISEMCDFNYPDNGDLRCFFVKGISESRNTRNAAVKFLEELRCIGYAV